MAVAFSGDGASNEGAFHESLNLAAVWELPVVFVCENNLYGFSTHYQRTTAGENIAARAQAYAIPGLVVDGMDVTAVYVAAGEAVQRAREGLGPGLVECKTYRLPQQPCPPSGPRCWSIWSMRQGHSRFFSWLNNCIIRIINDNRSYLEFRSEPGRNFCICLEYVYKA